MTTRERLTTIGSHHREPVEEAEEVNIPFPVNIFDATYLGEYVPSGFDAVRILIDGKFKADLSWKIERETALEYLAQGLRIFWEIDLGLPNILHHSLGNRTQFLALTLSLEHFFKTLWQEFRQESLGLCLYRGSLDFSKDYPWDEEQTLNLQDWIHELYPNIDSFAKEACSDITDFKCLTYDFLIKSEIGKILLKYFCRDAVSEYLNLLASGIPDHLPLFLLFDATERINPYVEAQLLNKECYPRFHLGVKHSLENRVEQVLGGEIAWGGCFQEKGRISREIKDDKRIEKAKLALCLPSRLICRPSSTEALNQALALLQKYKVPFRVIPEGELAIEWEGLDDLIVDTELVSFQFKRKLQGFYAAGGTVISIGKPLGLAEEIPFDNWINSKRQFC